MSVRRRDRLEVVRFTGSNVQAFEVEETSSGVLRSLTAPHYEFAADVCTLVRPGLYAVAIDEVTMRSESDFHRSRRRIATGALFENNSDLMDLARNIAMGVMFVVCIILLFQVGHIAGVIDVVAKSVK